MQYVWGASSTGRAILPAMREAGRFKSEKRSGDQGYSWRISGAAG
jgi:hypothetical protein